MNKKRFGVILLVAMLSLPATARATSDTRDEAIQFFMLSLGQGIVLAGSAVTGIGTGVSLGVHEPPSTRWLVSGYVFGGLNMALGIANMATHEGAEFNLALGAAQLTAATLNIVLSSVALYMRGKSVEAAPPAPAGIEVAGMNLSVAPLVAQDAGGGAAVGMGVQLMGW